MTPSLSRESAIPRRTSRIGWPAAVITLMLAAPPANLLGQEVRFREYRQEPTMGPSVNSLGNAMHSPAPSHTKPPRISSNEYKPSNLEANPRSFNTPIRPSARFKAPQTPRFREYRAPIQTLDRSAFGPQTATRMEPLRLGPNAAPSFHQSLHNPSMHVPNMNTSRRILDHAAIRGQLGKISAYPKWFKANTAFTMISIAAKFAPDPVSEKAIITFAEHVFRPYDEFKDYGRIDVTLQDPYMRTRVTGWRNETFQVKRAGSMRRTFQESYSFREEFRGSNVNVNGRFSPPRVQHYADPFPKLPRIKPQTNDAFIQTGPGTWEKIPSVQPQPDFKTNEGFKTNEIFKPKRIERLDRRR